MALGGCLTCIRYLLFIFNFLFWLIGCVILSLGIWLVVDPSSLGDAADKLRFGGYGFIAVGSIIMIIGFFGCCGAMRESQCLLATFFVFLLIIFLILLGLGIFAVVYRKEFEDEVVKDMNTTYISYAKKYKQGGKEKTTVDEQNKAFQCCGYKDMEHRQNDFDGAWPEFEGCKNSTTPFCPDAFSNTFKLLKGHLVILGAVALGVALVLLLGMIFSMMLCCAIRDNM